MKTTTTRQRNWLIWLAAAAVVAPLLLTVVSCVMLYQALHSPNPREVERIRGEMTDLQTGKSHILKIYNDDAMAGFLANLKMADGITAFELDIMYVGRFEEALKHIEGLDSIGTLSVSKKYLDDAALESIATLPNLTELRLYKVRVSAEGLALLARCPRLERLNLYERADESLSLAEFESLERALPNTKIVAEHR